MHRHPPLPAPTPAPTPAPVPASPGEIDGHSLAVLLLLNFYCRVRLPESSGEARRRVVVLLMELVYQVVPPTESLQQFLKHVRDALACDSQQAEVVCDYLHRTLEILHVSDGLTKLFNEKFSRILAPYESIGLPETSEVFVDRRSFFGLYFRRVKLVFDSLDLQGRGRLRDVAIAWKDGELAHANHDEVAEAEDDEADGLRVAAYKRYRTALLTGDFSKAKESMQKSFDYYAPGSDHELHQHTLLHLATFHYQTGGLKAAAAALDEAISLSRSADDHECIAMCESLMRRLQGEGTSRLAPQQLDVDLEQVSSHDALWQAQSDMDNGSNLTTILQQLTTTLRPPPPPPSTASGSGGGGNPKSSTEISLHLMEDATRRFGKNAAKPDAVLARLWQGMGQDGVASVYRDRAMRLDKTSASEAVSLARVAAVCAKANRLARRGRYTKALTLLLHPSTYEALSFNEYRSWTDAVWNILWLRARRRGETRTLDLLARSDPTSSFTLRGGEDIEDLVEMPNALRDLIPTTSTGAELDSSMMAEEGRNVEETRGSSTSSRLTETEFGRRSNLTFEQKVEMLVDKAWKLIDAGQPTRAQSPALLAVALSRDKGHVSLQHSAHVVLARLTAQGFKLHNQAMQALEEVLPQIMSADDVELRALASLTYAECWIGIAAAEPGADGAPSRTKLQEALIWLHQASKDMETTSLLTPHRRTLYMLARVAHQLDRPTERDEAIDALQRAELAALSAGSNEATQTPALREVEEVLQLVHRVGARVAAGDAARLRSL